MKRILIVAGLLLVGLTAVPWPAGAQPGSGSAGAAVRAEAAQQEEAVSAHGNRRPREEVSPEEKAAQYARMWAAVAGAGAAAVFGVVMRRRLGRGVS